MNSSVDAALLAFASVRLLLFESPMSLLAANLSALSMKSQRYVTRAVATFLVTANEASAISFHGTPTFATAAAALIFLIPSTEWLDSGGPEDDADE